MQNEDIMNLEQFEFCVQQANILARSLMSKDVKHIFGKEGNANFVLQTLIILTSGTLLSFGKIIDKDALTILPIFYEQVHDMMKANKGNFTSSLTH